MALTIIKNINKYNMSRSEMLFGLETDAYVIATGTKAAQKLGASGTCLAGGVFDFKNANGETFQFTIVSGTPDYNNNEVREKGAGTFAGYLAMLAIDFNSNYSFSELYSFSSDGTYLYITAKNIGIKYQLVSNSTLTDTGCNISAYGGAWTDAEYAENYRMLVDVWMESENALGDYTKAGTMELPAVNNQCEFDLQKIVNANLRYDFPTFDQNTVSDCLQVVKRFYCRYIEKYGNPVAYKKLNTSDVVIALKGGLNTLQLSEDELWSTFYTQGNFLTRQPRTKKVSAIQQEYLYFAPKSDVGTTGAILDVVIYFKDRSVEAVSLMTTAMAASFNHVYCIPTGFKALGLDVAHNFNDVLKWTVAVKDVVGVGTTELFTYYADNDVYRDERFFLFANSDGGVDTFRATGENIWDEETEFETVQNANKKFYKKGALKTDQMKQASGFITADQSKWLTDLFLSEEVYELIDGQKVPIVITTKRKPTNATQRAIHAFEFDYYYAFTDAVTFKPQL